MKVISYNILSDKWCMYREDVPSTHKLKERYAFVAPELLLWENRLPKIINIIKDYDIICLQEVDIKFIPNIIALLPEYQYAHHEINKKRTNVIGNMTLWKNIKSIASTVNSCAIFTTFEKFILINVHLKGGKSCEKDRIFQLKSTIKNIEGPVCICGDFNDEFQNELPKLLSSFTFYENQLTCDCYDHEHHYHSFDHVVSKNLTIIQQPCPTISPIPNDDNPSDHLPLTFIIK